MSDALIASIRAASAGLATQSMRVRIAAENLANAYSTGSTPGADPYARKTVTFANELDEQSGVEVVKVDNIGVDSREFPVSYEPGHPAADERGYVKRPNVDPMLEIADMREANRSYLANLQMVKSAREAVMLTIDLLRGN
jgi:flagellar basal-body rod protein FlgC